MNPKKYLTDLLEKSSQFTLTTQVSDAIKSLGLEQFLFQHLASKKFRKYKMTPECVTRVRNALKSNLAKNKPLTVVYPQGGYKLWHLPSSPTVDWAEFFTISYVLEYLAPIAAAYEPGVELIFYMHAMLPELHDNLTTEEINAYIESFEKLLQQFRPHLPQNVSIRILRDLDFYSREEYIAAAETAVQQAALDYPQWPDEKKQAMHKMAHLNIKWKGREDWTNLTEKQREEKLYLAALYESSATSKLERISATVKSADNILLFNTGMRDFIGIGTTKASIAKYWVGFGILQEKGDAFLPIILSPSQYERVFTDQKPRSYASKLIPLPNFKKIFVLSPKTSIF